MATVAGVGSWIAPGVHQKVWTLGNADSGSVHDAANLPDKTFQVVGTWGSATLVIQGSNDGTNWTTLNDPQGGALSFTTGSPTDVIAENPRYVRPTTSGGTGTALVCTIISQSAKR